MELDKLRSASDLLAYYDYMKSVQEVLENYDSQIRVVVSSVHNHNRERGISKDFKVTLDLENMIKDYITKSIVDTRQQIESL